MIRRMLYLSLYYFRYCMVFKISILPQGISLPQISNFGTYCMEIWKNYVSIIVGITQNILVDF